MKHLLLSVFIAFAFSSTASADAKAGEALYFKKCKSCHAFGSKKMGPDLNGISKRANKAWVVKWLKDTKGTWAANDATTQDLKKRVGYDKKAKHKTPRKLTDADFGNIADFLMTK